MTDRRTFLKGMGAVLGLTLLSVNIADEKKVKTLRYCMEFEQDLKFYGLDSEYEMMCVFAEELGTTPDNVVVLSKRILPMDYDTFMPRAEVKVTTKK